VPGARPEVYVYGMRNPYRFSIDPPTGDMYLADVGGTNHEEVDYLPRGQIAGTNLGWHCFEGTLAFKPCGKIKHHKPEYQYPSGPDVVIGGFVVHTPDLPSLAGRYLYGQYNTGLWTLGPHAAPPAVNVSSAVSSVTDVGQDGAGHVYVTSYDGPVYRIGESAGALTATKVGDFIIPTEAQPVPGNPNALFVVEKQGTVRLLSGGVSSTFLDISDRVRDEGYEEGLLGFVAAPDYATSHRTFAFYSDNAGDIQVDQYRDGARSPVLTIPHPYADAHHGGMLAFGADGYLYLSTGDGDPQGDVRNDAQRLDSLLGKVLRIDVSATTVDTRKPRLRPTVPKEQRVLRLHGVAAYASCNERCSVFASASARIGGRTYELPPTGAAERAGQQRRLKVALTASATRALKRALKRHRKITVRLKLRAEDPTGNATGTTRSVLVSR
jgi:glucose/sorbosone dehydrogenase